MVRRVAMGWVACSLAGCVARYEAVDCLKDDDCSAGAVCRAGVCVVGGGDAREVADPESGTRESADSGLQEVADPESGTRGDGGSDDRGSAEADTPADGGSGAIDASDSVASSPVDAYAACEPAPGVCPEGAAPRPYYADVDGDGHGDPSACVMSCGPVTGYVVGADDCDDQDRLRYPGAAERWDLRDNDCDGGVDEDALTRWDRYVRTWSASDVEHRFATHTPAGFNRDGHYMVLYPPDVCSNEAYGPIGRCEETPGFGGPGTNVVLELGHLAALSECRGSLGVHHVSLYLLESSGEYDDYVNFGPLDCDRIGYVFGSGAEQLVPTAVEFHRHQSGFGPTGYGDVMWSSIADEGATLRYDVHRPAWWVHSGY